MIRGVPLISELIIQIDIIFTKFAAHELNPFLFNMNSIDERFSWRSFDQTIQESLEL